MKLQYKIFSIIMLCGIFAKAQVGIIYKPTTEFTPHSSAILHLEVGNLADGQKKGFLMPRLNLQTTAIGTPVTSPINGLWVYNLANTSGTNGVKADHVYKWNGARWDSYFSKEELITFLKPNNYYLRSFTSQILTSSERSTFNSNNPIIVTWDAADVVIANDPQITRVNSTEFQVNQTGIYNVAGFFNCHPELSSSDSSNIMFILQIDRGLGFVDFSSVTKAIEVFSGTTYQSIAFPSTVISLAQNNKLRIVFRKTSSNHGSGAGIQSASGVGTKSLRISFMSEL